MPAVATPPANEAGIDTDQDWPIQTSWVRARVRHSQLDGTLTVSRPERRVCPDHHEETSWASMWRTKQQWADLTEQEALELKDELDARAQRRYQLDRLEEAITQKKHKAQERRREKARAQLLERIRFAFPYLRDAYEDDPPVRYEGGDSGEATHVPFGHWVPSQLDPAEAERLAEMKTQVREAYDLPGYVQLL